MSLLEKSNSIPIENIYYMLCYSWDKLQYINRNNVGVLESKDIQNLLSRVLIDEVSTLVKKGIYKEYIEMTEDTKTLRGKINFDESLQLIATHRTSLNCTYDELDSNNLFNSIIKTTMLNLLKTYELAKENRMRLRNLVSYFSSISKVKLNKRIFSSLKFNKLNKEYKFIINVCELIFDNLLISDKGDKAEFFDFLQDERQMAYLFESFVRNFYKRELLNSKVYREDIKWQFIGEDMMFLPKMQTDISLEYNEHKFIIDTKYYKNALSSNFGYEKIISSNLYQIYSYLKNIECKSEKDKNSTGILLYPRVSKDINLKYNFETHDIKVCTVNLACKWQDIHERLIYIID